MLARPGKGGRAARRGRLGPIEVDSMAARPRAQDPLKNPTRIACVIPAFQRESTLGRAISSALDQTRVPDEIVVVDDGSTDRTAEVARSFGAAVRHVRQDNAGGAAARNRGVLQATADWIAFLDSDDWWTPSHLAAIERAIVATDGRADFYFGDMERPGPDGTTIRQWTQARFDIEGEWALVEDGQAWVARPRMPMMLQSSVFHRERFLAKGGLWDELRRRHDTHAFVRHGTRSPICAVRNVGTVMTPDDAGGRLTEQMGPRSHRYHEYSVMLWSDLLRRVDGLEPARRDLLRHRLTRARIRLARARLAERRPVAAAAEACRALACRPSTLLATLLRRNPNEWAMYPELA